MSLVQLLGWKLARGGGEAGWVLEPESSPALEKWFNQGKNRFFYDRIVNIAWAKPGSALA